MREIKFRGKRLDNGEWVYGDLVRGLELVYGGTEVKIHVPPIGDNHHNIYDVDPKSVGEYAGLKDRKGQEVYEDDIVTFDDAHYQIVFKGEGWTLRAVHSDNLDPYDMPNLCMQELNNNPGHTRTDVVGNTHDNPELLK